MHAQDQAPSPFIGQWIGETQGCESPAHIWEIRQRWSWLELYTHWEGEAPSRYPMHAELIPGEPAFMIRGTETFTATLVDPQHFVIPGWDTNDMRGGEGPAYDVVFSRPGLAELTAREAYLRFKERGAGS
jgi:hypothetical protein